MYEPDSGWNAVWTGAPEDEPPEGADGNDDDYDGLANWLEDHYGTDRYTPDSDYDGVTDGDEIFLLGTDPLNWDTDGNSYSDADDAYFSAYGHYPWETPDPEPDPDPEDPPPDDPSLAITTTEVPTIMESAPYSFRFTAEGGVGSYTWTLVSGALPGDLSLGSDGTLTGDGGSASEGQYSFEVAVQDSDSNSVSQMFSIIVYWPPDPGDPPVDDPGDSGPDPEADSDSDGVPNGIEWQLDSNAEQWDSMNPGVSDWFYWYFSHLGPSAADPDADGDGLGELLETAIGTSDTHWDSLGTFYGDRHHYYLQVLAQGAPETDSDGDSLGDLLEQTLGMNPQDPDSDGDGFSDADEWSNIAWSSPWQWDTDGDGLHDGLEAQIGTQARQVDTDGDHLTDSEEHHGVYGPLDPLLWSTAQNGRPDYMDADLTDSDGGGIPDRLETFWGLNPNNAADEQGDIDADGVTNLEEYMTGYDIWGGWRDNLDWDGDGLTNVYELFYGLDPNDPSDGADDPDGDFLTNYEESLAYTHPQLAFTVVDFVAENRLPSILVLDANGEPVLDAESNPVYRHPVNDYEGYFGQDFATATAHLIRDNGPDPAREQDDDWDGDSLSNYEELYHSGTNPREAEAPIALELSPSGGWLGEVEPGGYVSLAFGAAGGTPPYAWSASVPAWLELNATTGEIQGAVPQDSSPGNLSLSVTLTDALGQSLTGQFDLEILSPPTTSCQCLGSSCHCSESGQCQEMCGDGGGGGGGGPVPPIDCGCLASGCPGSSCSGCGGQCSATPCECSNGDCNASVCADNSAVCLGGCVTPPTACSDPQCACAQGGGVCPPGCPGNCGGCDCGGGLCDQVCGTNNKSNGQNPCGTGGSCDDTHTQTPCTCGCGLESCAKEPGAEAAPCVCWCDCGCNEDASSLRKCGAPRPDDKCAAGSGQAPYPCSASTPAVELKQENMPNFGLAENTTDMGSPYSTAAINSGGIAYITGEPAMPQLKVSFRGLDPSINVDWRLEIKSERTERGTKDDKNYPASGYKTLPGNQTWDIGAEFGTDFVGGKCKLFYNLAGAAEQTLEFFIRGKNPMDASARNHIQSTQGNHRFAWAMAQHESRQGQRVYNHFNSGGSTKELPNFGPPDGWGIAQLDKPLGVSATTNEVYSWHANIAKFYSELGEKQQLAQSYFNKIQAIYPGQWEAPPQTWTRQGTNTSMSALEAAVIQLYNGAAVIVWVKNNQIVPSGTSGASVYISCWRFHPNNASGQKWEFVPNQNNYLYKVIHDEFEGNTGIQ